MEKLANWILSSSLKFPTIPDTYLHSGLLQETPNTVGDGGGWYWTFGKYMLAQWAYEKTPGTNTILYPTPSPSSHDSRGLEWHNLFNLISIKRFLINFFSLTIQLIFHWIQKYVWEISLFTNQKIHIPSSEYVRNHCLSVSGFHNGNLKAVQMVLIGECPPIFRSFLPDHQKCNTICLFILILDYFVINMSTLLPQYPTIPVLCNGHVAYLF